MKKTFYVKVMNSPERPEALKVLKQTLEEYKQTIEFKNGGTGMNKNGGIGV